ncbi:hypothetical protein SERLA73DRAFT_181260 [Serpula lacrymans var. lacrymans S7.3]|uniref:Uncharacterized protein n=2 Tax=Serpula lacrymans var. lacrymans TaxID=341189 RepID=F8PXR6_SERL3|nr:uncharacterized protein SERLADRAFT_415439 [Serpula lacrymans var. lacrymans S7.9]EGN98679.1 hypothetical protein SERLA73DRAFT_181260 [Serpula lacrymans var. lacrymans S7.3]EGO24282.1 hypothetical protein SERLADRAFT_415439 [Serpula lacrymans var. lacrymans S7.9]
MLPVANLHLKDLYDTTVEFFALRSPTFAFRAFTSDYTDSSGPSTPRDLSPGPDHARLAKDGTSLRERLDAAGVGRVHCPSSCSCRYLGPSSTANSTIYSMSRRELDAAKNELSRSQTEVAKLDDRCKILEKTLSETRDMLRTRDAEIEWLKKEREKLLSGHCSRSMVERAVPGDRRRSQESTHSRHSSGQAQDLSMQWIENQGMMNTSPTNGYHAKKNGEERSSFSSTTEEERAQAKSLETFLTKSDLWSGAQVIQTVQDLNSEILQFAASATELCTFVKHPRVANPKPTQATNETTTRLGPTFCRILSTRDHTQDPMLVQLALQGCISICISRALSTFCLGYQSKTNTILAQIYSRMIQEEPQPMSSRWRALTHKHIHGLHPELEDYISNELTETIFRWSLDVFLISGSSNPQTVPSSRENFKSRFGAQVRRIAKAVYKLAQVTREEIMSTNFEVIAVESGKAFDAQEVVDAFEDYGTSKGAVLCTTELGLRCSTRKSPNETGKPEGEGCIERRCLLRPKVVLESVVEVLDPR